METQTVLFVQNLCILQNNIAESYFLLFFLYNIEQDPKQLTEADVEAMSVGKM